MLLLVSLPHFTNAPKGCWVHDLTGYPCPGCGSSRAGLSLLRGDLQAAFLYNPLITTALLAGLAIAVLRVVAGWQTVLRLSRRGWQILSLVLVVLVAANWLYLLSFDGS